MERPLVSVSQLARTGHRVEFGVNEGWTIHEQSGRRIRLQRSGGLCLIEMLVRDPGAAEADPACLEGTARRAAGFSRPR